MKNEAGPIPMKFAVRKAERPRSPTTEELCVAERLNKLAARRRVEESLYPEPPKEPGPPRIKRIFWTPDEL